MSKKNKKPQKLRARLPRGFVDRSADDIRAQDAMIAKIKAVYEKYGFDPVETPMFEYTDCLGKFLPDSDRPNEGVFSLTDDDDHWMSLRYDLTAPLARHVAENINEIQLPYRTYRAGYVFRNEKPGPGRFRQFMQFDADTVGAPGVQADAEMCMMMADVMEVVGLEGQFLVRVNNRKVLDGILEALGILDDKKLIVLRALDKYDRLGEMGVKHLLQNGRVDESGDFTNGANLDAKQVELLLALLKDQLFAFLLLPKNVAVHNSQTYAEYLADFEPDKPEDFASFEEYEAEASLEPWDEAQWQILHNLFVESEETDSKTSIEFIGNLKNNPFQINKKFRDGVDELLGVIKLCVAAGYSALKVRPDVTCVRGLEYYTGTVFEAELTFKVKNEKGEEVVFGSVGGGGRYDGLVKRFTGQDVPATGFSIGVSRLMTALKNNGLLEGTEVPAPVLVTVMDKNELGTYQGFVQQLREAGIRAEMYQGNPNKFGKQLQYADRRGCPIAIIQGSDEREAGKLQLKDLIEGKREAAAIESNEEYRAARPGQFEIAESDLVAEVKKLLAEQANA